MLISVQGILSVSGSFRHQRKFGVIQITFYDVNFEERRKSSQIKSADKTADVQIQNPLEFSCLLAV